MNREIKFRGKRKDGEWVYGYYCKNGPEHRILEIDDDGKGFIVDDVEVLPETVGVFIGEKDNESREAYHGDIIVGHINTRSGLVKITAVILFDVMDGVALEDSDGKYYSFADLKGGEFSVIGNIHDNPDFAMGGE